jgi:GAF domain-containing protein/HAMP domain-containing protein
VILNMSDPTIQNIAWILSMVAGTLALYILALNWRHPTNQLVALLLAVVAVNNFAEGALLGAGDGYQALLPIVLLAITTPMILPLLMIVTPRLLKPEWLKDRWRWIWWGMGGLALLPGVLTLVDLLSGTRLFFTGLAQENYQGGFIPLAVYSGGAVASVLKGINFIVLFFLLVVFYIYVAIFDKNTSQATKILAWILFGAVGVSGALLIAFQALFPISFGPLLISSLFGFVYGYAAFHQMISEHRRQIGNLRARLTVLVLVVTAPLLFALAFLITARVGDYLEQRSLEILKTVNQGAIANTDLWLDYHTRVLRQVSTLSDVTSMEGDRQKPVLDTLALTYDYLYLVSTTDLSGRNLARSSGESLATDADQVWFQDVIGGEPITYQTLAGSPNGQSSLAMAVPIYGKDLKIAGVLMLASELAELQKRIEPITFGESGYIFLVDEMNRVIVHPELSYITELRDLSTYPPVAMVRQGKQGQLKFVDDGGVRWRAYGTQLENGWGVIAQQTEAEILAPRQTLRQVSFWISLVGLSFLSVVVWLTVRQSLHPVQSLTRTASAILEGNLNRKAPVESEDELGFLAETFNKMTRQLRDSISNLEERVARRTADLERRSNQLQAAAMVSKEVAGIRDVQQMLSQTAKLISRYFDFYHAGIFIIDDAHEYAVLQAANSEGGQRMLARGHKLRVGQVGIVGYVADVGVPRIALDVGADAVFFNNPDLPMTRSEMALPLKARGRVIGVLDVQSIEESAFSNEDIETLQVMADQVALALDNAQLLQESRDALEELRVLYGQQTRQVWKEHLERGPISFRYTRTGLILGEDSLREENQQNEAELTPVTSPILQMKDGKHEMQVPLILRGQVLGSLILRRELDQKSWSQDDLRLAVDLIAQVLPALENARLVEEIQERAQLESLVGQVSSRIQGSLDLETVLKTAVQEIGLAVNATRVQIRLEKDGEGENSPNEKQ